MNPMWIYKIRTGEIFREHETMVFRVAMGYAGTGDGRNNPASVAVKNVGPLPPGMYKIGAPLAHSHLGPGALPLTPYNETNDMHGRFGFYIHADNVAHDASHGCIVLSVPTLTLIARSEIPILCVVP